MKQILIAAGLLACATSTVYAQERTDSALAYFQDYCLEAGGDMQKSIALLSASEHFDAPFDQSSGNYTALLFMGLDGTLATVTIGGEVGYDRCIITASGVADPMAQSETWAGILADEQGADFTQLAPFDMYGNGGFGYRDAQGNVVVAPVTTGISDDIVHLSFYPK
ncbi:MULTISPECIES: hypothetical protein [unclassified Halomonas]|uniref:hypothetical protein n=1 Tax=unclassified Halomonas TaxID=2609666 RepID=UPI0021E4D133|nr:MULTISPECIES: hypothetical protein [unclassified Halomonas]UYF98867.1 hypothetical protein OCT39_11580 [Halomonas sp. GD1P12]WNL40016.1 hypothetical protein RN346_05485 [Halomonas sp. PAMB 3232]